MAARDFLEAASSQALCPCSKKHLRNPKKHLLKNKYGLQHPLWDFIFLLLAGVQHNANLLYCVANKTALIRAQHTAPFLGPTRYYLNSCFRHQLRHFSLLATPVLLALQYNYGTASAFWRAFFARRQTMPTPCISVEGKHRDSHCCTCALQTPGGQQRSTYLHLDGCWFLWTFAMQQQHLPSLPAASFVLLPNIPEEYPAAACHHAWDLYQHAFSWRPGRKTPFSVTVRWQCQRNACRNCKCCYKLANCTVNAGLCGYAAWLQPCILVWRAYILCYRVSSRLFAVPCRCRTGCTIQTCHEQHFLCACLILPSFLPCDPSLFPSYMPYMQHDMPFAFCSVLPCLTFLCLIPCLAIIFSLPCPCGFLKHCLPAWL